MGFRKKDKTGIGLPFPRHILDNLA